MASSLSPHSRRNQASRSQPIATAMVQAWLLAREAGRSARPHPPCPEGSPGPRHPTHDHVPAAPWRSLDGRADRAGG